MQCADSSKIYEFYKNTTPYIAKKRYHGIFIKSEIFQLSAMYMYMPILIKL